MRKFIGKKTNKIVCVRNIDNAFDSQEEVFYTDSPDSNEVVLLELSLKYEEEFRELTDTEEYVIQYNELMSCLEDKIEEEINRIRSILKYNTFEDEKILFQNKISCQSNPWNSGYEYYITGVLTNKLYAYIEDDYDNTKIRAFSYMTAPELIGILRELECIKEMEDVELR